MLCIIITVMEHHSTVCYVTFTSASIENQGHLLSEIKINEMLHLMWWFHVLGCFEFWACYVLESQFFGEIVKVIHNIHNAILNCPVKQPIHCTEEFKHRWIQRNLFLPGFILNHDDWIFNEMRISESWFFGKILNVFHNLHNKITNHPV